MCFTKGASWWNTGWKKTRWTAWWHFCFSLCEFLKFTQAARAPGDWIKEGKYQPKEKVDEKCTNCSGQKDEEEKLAGGFNKLCCCLVAKESVLFARSYQKSCVRNCKMNENVEWKSWTKSFDFVSVVAMLSSFVSILIFFLLLTLLAEIYVSNVIF